MGQGTGHRDVVSGAISAYGTQAGALVLVGGSVGRYAWSICGR